MSQLATQVAALLKGGPLTVYQIADRLSRPESSIKTIIFDMRRCGFVESVSKGVYPTLYANAAGVVDGPVSIKWKKRDYQPKAMKTTPGVVAHAMRTRPALEMAWGAMA